MKEMTRDNTAFHKTRYCPVLSLDLCLISFYSTSLLPWRLLTSFFFPQGISKHAHLSSDLKTDRWNRRGEKLFLRLHQPIWPWGVIETSIVFIPQILGLCLKF